MMEADTQSQDITFRLLAWLHANRKQVITTAVIVVVVGAAVGAYTWKVASDESNSDATLMNLPSAPGADPQMGPVTATPYLDLARQYPNTPAGRDADLIGAETLFLEGNYAQAEQVYNQFLNEHPDSDLLPQAMMGVAASLEAEGKTADAMRKYQEIISAYPTDAGIVEPAMLTLARLNEGINKPEQALSYYAQLARNQSPYDPWAAEARERAVLLLAHHPELRQAPQQSASASANPFATEPTSGSSSAGPRASYAPGPPLRQPSAEPSAPPPQQPATAPSAPAKQASPGINFLNIPNKTAKP